MVSATRAEIVHVDLGEAPGTLVVAHALYWFIFWYRDRPVGQLELPTAGHMTLDLADLASRAVPAETLTEARRALAVDTRCVGPEAKVSVVICTRDRPDQLARCLASFPQQSRVPSEIIVVDNASIDRRTQAAALAAGVVYVREDRPGLDIARNTGALAATGDIILYTDDDVVLHPRWVERMVAAFDDGIDAVTGIVLPAELETAAQLHFERFWGFGKGFRRRDFAAEFFAADRSVGCPAWDIGAGANMAFRAAVFREVGLFDDRLDVGAAGCSGDSEYWHRLLTHGRVCRYDPGVIVFHYHRRDMAGLRKQLHAYMRGHSAALLVQFERSRNIGNIRRLVRTMPVWFVSRALGRDSIRTSRMFLLDEAAGFVGGIAYYLGRKLDLRRKRQASTDQRPRMQKPKSDDR